MKKILIIANTFYPVNTPRAIRATELAIEFARQGHIVSVLTPKNEIFHSEFESKYKLKIIDLGKAKWRSPDFGKSKIGYFLTRAFFRLFNLLIEYPDIELLFKVRKRLKKMSGYDILISIAVPYPIHWGVAAVWKHDKPRNPAKIWIADCGDPYMGLENDTFKKLFYFKYVEKWFCRKTDFLSIPFEGGKKGYYKEFWPKIRIIPQGFRFPQRLNNTEKRNSPITFAYSGTIGSYKDFAPVFLTFLNSITTDFRFLVFTQEKEFYENYLTENSMAKCEFNDYIPRYDLLNKLKKVDFLLHFPYNNTSQKSMKLIDYHFLGKPILSFSGDEKSKSSFIEFLDYNFDNKLKSEDISIYYIENVSRKFLEVAKEAANDAAQL